MPFIATERHKLHYRATGNPRSPALLLLHGFLGSYQDFSAVLTELSKHFYCITPDLPGHGQTLTQPNCYTFTTTAQTLLRLLDALEVEQTHLLGYSMGGRLALYLACCFPERFVRAVLESASPGLRTVGERQERKERDWAIARQIETTTLPVFLSRWYENPLFDSVHQHPALYRSMLVRRQQNNSVELANALRGFSTGCQPALWEQLANINRPLLFVVGEQDSKFVSIAEEMLAICRPAQAAIQICAGCGHSIHLEDPAQFVRAVVRHSLFDPRIHSRSSE